MTNKFRDCVPTVVRERLEIGAGDYFEFDVFVTNSAGSYDAFDLTGCVLTFIAANDLDNPSHTIEKSTLDGGIIIMNAAGGQVRVVLEPSDTLVLGPEGGFMFYEVKLEDTNVRFFTVASGELIILNNLS